MVAQYRWERKGAPVSSGLFFLRPVSLLGHCAAQPEHEDEAAHGMRKSATVLPFPSLNLGGLFLILACALLLSRNKGTFPCVASQDPLPVVAIIIVFTCHFSCRLSIHSIVVLVQCDAQNTSLIISPVRI